MSNVCNRVLSLVLAMILAFGLVAPGLTVSAAGLDDNAVPEPVGDTAGTYTVTYTDGVAEEEIFPDQIYTVDSGAATPAFDGTPSRTNWNFTGWDSEIAETVTGNVTYTAQWEKATNNKPKTGVTENNVEAMEVRFYAIGTESVNPNKEPYSVGGTAGKIGKNIPYEIGEIQGNDVDGYTQTVTFHFAHGDALEASGSAAFNRHTVLSKYPEWMGTWTYCFTEEHPADQVLTLEYNASMRKWVCPGSNNMISAAANHIQLYMELLRTVTYTDGVEGKEVFPDQVYSVRTTSATPAFAGTPERLGYSFIGWEPKVAETVAEDVTYTAQWEVKYVTVTYTDGVEDEEIFPDQVYTIQEGTAAPAFDGTPSRTNWNFTGWDPDPSAAESVTSDTTFTAQWEKATNNKPKTGVTENNVEAMEVRFYAIGTESVNPNKEPYSVGGTAGKIGKNIPYEIGEIQGNDVDGYTQTVTFHFAHGDALEASGSAAFNRHTVLSKYPEWMGTWTYCFTEEHPADQVLTLEYNASMRKWVCPGANNMISAVANHIQLYMELLRTVTYTDGVEGKEVFPDQVYTVRTTSATPAFVGTPERAGYTFTRWTPDISATVTADVTYTAAWTANTYTLTLDGNNGGRSSFEPVTVTYDQPVGQLPWGMDYKYSDGKCTYVLDGWNDADGNPVTAQTLYQVAGDSTIYARWVQLPGSSSTHVTNELFTIQCTTNHDHKWVVNWFGSHVKLVADSVAWDEARGCWTASATFSNFSLINSTITKNNYFGGFTHYYEKGQSITIQMYYDPNATGLNSRGAATTGLWLPDGEFVAEVYCYDKPAAPGTTTVEKLDKIIWTHENGSYPDGPKATSKYVTSRKLIAGTYTLGQMYEENGSFYCELTITDLAPYVKAFTDKYGAGYRIDTIHSLTEYKYLLKYTGSTTDYKQDGTGWTVDASSYASSSEKLNGKSLWLTNKYDITVHPNNGEEDFTVLVTYGSAAEVPDVSRTGYTFAGWADENGNAVDLTAPYDGSYTELTAQWTANTYQVSFDSNGGDTVAPITVTYDAKYGTLPSAGYIDGFQNGGWYLVDENGNVTDTKIEKRTVVTTARDHVLFQNRSIKAPNVKVDIDTPCESIPPKYEYYYKPDSRRVLTVSFVKEFNGDMLVYTYQWYKDGVPIEGATEHVLNLEGNVSDSGEYKCVVTAVKADSCTVVTTNTSAETTLTIKVTIRKAANTIQYDANGGEGGPVNNFANANYASVQTTQPTRSGYTFAGWNTEADGSGDAYKGGDKYVFTGDTGNGGEKVILYAQWTANTYTVTLDANGGEVDPESLTMTYDAELGELPVPTKAGYTFTGWTDPEGNPVTAETVYTTAGDSTLTAQWSASTYTVTLNANGGQVDPESLTATYNEALGQLPVPTRAGYTFNGWTDQQGNPVTAETVYTATENTTLTAQWTANTYTVTLDANGGEVDPESLTVTFGAALGQLPVPTRTGYTFTGWTDQQGNPVTAETVYTTAGDSTLTAQWTINTYTVTLDPNGGQVDPESITVTHGQAIGKLPKPTREGYSFRGWKDENGKTVNAKTIVTGDMKLTAAWTRLSGSAKTGDSTPLLGLMATMLLCACGITVLLVSRRKRQR